MGNKFSTPKSMKKIPGDINEDQYIEMTYDGKVYCIQKRSNSDVISASIKQNFTGKTMFMYAIGMGQFANMNKQRTAHFYITETKPSNEPIPLHVDATSLKMFIKLFAIENNIKLENATFELKQKEQKESSFGKRKQKNILKQLRMDLKKLRSL